LVLRDVVLVAFVVALRVAVRAVPRADFFAVDRVALGMVATRLWG
jgi:hypothetical protein